MPGTWLFFGGMSYFGGHEVMLLRWLEELEKDADLVSPRLLTRQQSRLLEWVSAPVRCEPFAPLPSGWACWLDWWRELRLLRHTVHATKPEYVIVASGTLGHQVSHVVMLRLMGVRVLLYVPLLGTFASMGYRFGAWKDCFVRWFYAKVPRGWVAISEAQANEFRDWAQPRGPVFVLPNTVASSIEEAPRVELRALDPGQPLRVLVLGRFDSHQKGLDMLVAHLTQAQPDDIAGLHFRFVGDGPYKPRIEALLRAQPRLAGLVELQPWAPARAVIEGSDVLLLPSRYEGVPLVMLEAMALGIPVVSSDLPGTSPYVPPSMRFAVGDMRGAMAILRRLRPLALRQSLARQGREAFEAKASGRAFAERVRELVDSVRSCVKD